MNEVNADHVINSLVKKLADAEVDASYKDAVIIKLNEDIDNLTKDNENLREQLKENTKKKDNKKN